MTNRRNPNDKFPFPTWQEVAGAWQDYWTDWLYNSGEWTPQKYEEYVFYKQIPLISQGISMAEAVHENDVYMAKNQLSWSDVKNANHLPGSGSLTTAYAGTLNFVSSNIRRLYR